MAMIIITEQQQIEGLLELVHDWWFDIDKLSYNEAAGRVTVSLASKQQELSVNHGDRIVLVIENVKQVRIKDTENVGYYDLNEIIYDDSSNTLEISCGIPIEIKIVIDRLNIKAEKKPSHPLHQ